ncbi:Clavaminate synthase [Rhizoctonia solani]|uniref:Clavaminate synthase n=1 Tax=Rhizoctonia solani TaxID=456999 RepID=A0A8H7I582_9AGAM|nr:Clavaminate synthase [Rhizoctonia solani]
MSSGSDYQSDSSYDYQRNTLSFLEDQEWPGTVLVSLLQDLEDTLHPNTQDLIECGQNFIGSLELFELDPETVQSKLALGREWRRLYTDTVLLRCLKLLKEKSPIGKSENAQSNDEWERAIRLLDQAIILAGAPGEGRLELTLSCISFIQRWYLPLVIDISTPHRPHDNPPPSLSAFPARAQRPFVLPGFASSWPATTNWKSKSYLVSCAGRGRIVPVERGGDYRTDDWSVELVPWSDFLDKIGWGEEVDDTEQLYLAQHSLFTQFPKLRADIQVPDYVYAEPESHPCYVGPPGNNEQLVINACPNNTPSVQIVGFKIIWLAPPEASSGMYAFNPISKPSHEGDTPTEPSRNPKREGMMEIHPRSTYSLSQLQPPTTHRIPSSLATLFPWPRASS